MTDPMYGVWQVEKQVRDNYNKMQLNWQRRFTGNFWYYNI